MTIIKHRLVKLNLSEFISLHSNTLSCFAYFIFTIGLNKYFNNYVNSLNTDSLDEKLLNSNNIIQMNSEEFDSVLYQRQTCNYLCFCCFLYFALTLKNKLKLNGTFSDEKTTLYLFVCILNYLIKGFLSIPIFFIGINNPKSNNDKTDIAELLIVIPIMMNTVTSIFIVVLSIFSVCSTLLLKFFNYLNNYAKKITFTVEETYVCEVVEA
jgi:hypothetical protein